MLKRLELAHETSADVQSVEIQWNFRFLPPRRFDCPPFDFRFLPFDDELGADPLRALILPKLVISSPRVPKNHEHFAIRFTRYAHYFVCYVWCECVPSVVSFLWRCFSALVTGNRIKLFSSYSSLSFCARDKSCCARELSVISVGVSKHSSFKSWIIFELKVDETHWISEFVYLCSEPNQTK